MMPLPTLNTHHERLSHVRIFVWVLVSLFVFGGGCSCEHRWVSPTQSQDCNPWQSIPALARQSPPRAAVFGCLVATRGQERLHKLTRLLRDGSLLVWEKEEAVYRARPIAFSFSEQTGVPLQFTFFAFREESQARAADAEFSPRDRAAVAAALLRSCEALHPGILQPPPAQACAQDACWFAISFSPSSQRSGASRRPTAEPARPSCLLYHRADEPLPGELPARDGAPEPDRQGPPDAPLADAARPDVVADAGPTEQTLVEAAEPGLSERTLEGPPEVPPEPVAPGLCTCPSYSLTAPGPSAASFKFVRDLALTSTGEFLLVGHRTPNSQSGVPNLTVSYYKRAPAPEFYFWFFNTMLFGRTTTGQDINLVLGPADKVIAAVSDQRLQMGTAQPSGSGGLMTSSFSLTSFSCSAMPDQMILSEDGARLFLICEGASGNKQLQVYDTNTRARQNAPLQSQLQNVTISALLHRKTPAAEILILGLQSPPRILTVNRLSGAETFHDVCKQNAASTMLNDARWHQDTDTLWLVCDKHIEIFSFRSGTTSATSVLSAPTGLSYHTIAPSADSRRIAVFSAGLVATKMLRTVEIFDVQNKQTTQILRALLPATTVTATPISLYDTLLWGPNRCEFLVAGLDAPSDAIKIWKCDTNP